MPFSHAYGTQPWDRPSSWNEHIMPLDGTPQQLALGDLHAARQGGLVQADRADLANGRRRYIGCAGDDLHRLLLADIELADLQMVGIRVIDNLEDLAGHNVVDLRAEVVTSSTLEPDIVSLASYSFGVMPVISV